MLLSVPRSAKACVGSPRHRPGSGCSQLCHPPLGCRTAPTILWQPSPAGDTSDSVGSARSCRTGGEYELKTAWIHLVWRLIRLERLKNSVILIHHLTTYLCTSDRSCVHRAEWGRPFRPCRCSTPPHPSAASLCAEHPNSRCNLVTPGGEVLHFNKLVTLQTNSLSHNLKILLDHWDFKSDSKAFQSVLGNILVVTTGGTNCYELPLETTEKIKRQR